MTRDAGLAIVEGVRRHDAAAEAALFEECWRWRTTAWRNNNETAEDLAQDLFLRVWQAILGGALRNPHALARYIFETRRNMGIDQHRRDARVPIMVSLLPIRTHNPPHADTPETIMLRGERMAVVGKAARRLPKGQRRVIALSLAGEDTSDTNYSRVAKHRAIATLRARLCG